MLPLYLMSLGLGGVLIIASIALGGKDADGDADHDHDHDHDVGGDADHDLDGDQGHDLHHDHGHHQGSVSKDAPVSHWTPFLSMRFWTFTLAAFGLNGTTLSLLGVNALATGIASALVGLTIGYAVALLFQKLARDQVTSPVALLGLEGAEAKVLLPVTAESEGKVRLLVGGQDVDLPARTMDPGRMERGSKAMVVEVKNGVAVVTPVALRAKEH